MRGLILGTITGILVLGIATLAIPERPEEEEEQEVADELDVGIAATLFGCVSVVMMLYYLLHIPKPHIRKYTYETVSSTISIFCAVLLFQSCHDFVEEFFLEGASELTVVGVCFLHRMLWHVALQVTLARICRVNAEASARAFLMRNPDSIKELEVDLKCWGLLLAHINGFASINFWGSVQHLPFFSQNAFCSAITILLSVGFQWFLLLVTDWVREGTVGTDGRKDKLEALWDESAEETENDVMALTQSFLLVQTVRYAICGVFANDEGEEPSKVLFSHPLSHTIALYFFGVCCLLVYGGVVYRFGSKLPNEEEEESLAEELQEEESEEGPEEGRRTESRRRHEENSLRKLQVLLMCCGMSLAWSTFYASQWGLASFNWGDRQEDETLFHLVLAVCLSVVSFAMIWVLDFLAGLECTKEKVDRVLYEVVGALGILIGLAWEKNFDSAVVALASQTRHPILMKLPLSVFCALLVVPAWKLYMLPMIVHQGWRFGFVPTHATKCLDYRDEESVRHYLELIKHFSTFGQQAANPHLDAGAEATRRVPKRQSINVLL